jgi:hypothetical protein
MPQLRGNEPILGLNMEERLRVVSLTWESFSQGPTYTS